MSHAESTLVATTPDLSPTGLTTLSTTIAEHAEEYDRSGEFPWKSIRAVHQQGVLGATIGEKFGGPAITPTEQTRLLEALGYGDPSVALIVANTLAAHSSQQFTASIPETVYAEALAALPTKPVLFNTARAEPELGAPARGGLPSTTATRTRTGWLVEGRKTYVTASEGLTYHQVWVKTDDPEPRVGHVLVPGDDERVEVIKTWDHLGLRASASHDVRYNRVEVPEEFFTEIPRQADGRYRDPAAQGASLGVTALYLGVARAGFDAFITFSNERVPASLGTPLSHTERFQTVAGQISVLLTTASSLIYSATDRQEVGSQVSASELEAVKTVAVRSAIQSMQLAVEVSGNPGLSQRNPLQRHLRNILCARIHPPQEDAVLRKAGRVALGVD